LSKEGCVKVNPATYCTQLLWILSRNQRLGLDPDCLAWRLPFYYGFLFEIAFLRQQPHHGLVPFLSRYDQCRISRLRGRFSSCTVGASMKAVVVCKSGDDKVTVELALGYLLKAWLEEQLGTRWSRELDPHCSVPDEPQAPGWYANQEVVAPRHEALGIRLE
jgi:hypothetical protein